MLTLSSNWNLYSKITTDSPKIKLTFKIPRDHRNLYETFYEKSGGNVNCISANK